MAIKQRIPWKNQPVVRLDNNIKRIRILDREKKPTDETSKFLDFFSSKDKEHKVSSFFLGHDLDNLRVIGRPGDEFDVEDDLSLESAKSLITSGFAEPI